MLREFIRTMLIEGRTTDMFKLQRRLWRTLRATFLDPDEVRRRYAPKTQGAYRKNLPWDSVDFQTQSNKEIAQQLDVLLSQVSNARKRYAPETLGLRRGRPQTVMSVALDSHDIVRLKRQMEAWGMTSEQLLKMIIGEWLKAVDVE